MGRGALFKVGDRLRSERYGCRYRDEGDVGGGADGAGGGHEEELGGVLRAEYQDYLWVSTALSVLPISA